MAERDVDIEALFRPGNEGVLETYLRLLHPADIAELFDFVDEDSWLKITKRLDADAMALVMRELDEGQRERLGELMTVLRLAAVVDELETDDAADVLADLPDDKSEAVLEAIEDRAEVEVLLAYPDDSAGGIMKTELVQVQRTATVADAIEAVRRAKYEDELDDILEVYVVDGQGHLSGTLALQDLVLATDDVSIKTISVPIEASVTPEIDQEEVASLFRKYDLIALPVVAKSGSLIGRITFDDIHDVIEEEASEDIMAMAGTSDEELVYGNEFFRIAMLRLPWLVTSMVASLATAYLMGLFETLGDTAISMLVFVPTVMAMSGNLGSQSAMIVTRGLALGRVSLENVLRTVMREAAVGFIVGITIATMAGVVSYAANRNPMLGLALAASLVVSMIVSATVGVMAPIAFKRLGIDPAIAAGPLVTTGCDLLGVLIYLSFSVLLLT